MVIARDTQRRRAVMRTLSNAGRPLSPVEILELTPKDAPKMSLPTVYRAVKHLTDQGELVPVELPGQPCRYELAGKSHHHHFRCRRCESVYDIPGCGLASDQHDLPQGFTIEQHEVWLIGLCDRCSKKQRKA